MRVAHQSKKWLFTKNDTPDNLSQCKKIDSMGRKTTPGRSKSEIGSWAKRHFSSAARTGFVYLSMSLAAPKFDPPPVLNGRQAKQQFLRWPILVMPSSGSRLSWGSRWQAEAAD